MKYQQHHARAVLFLKTRNLKNVFRRLLIEVHKRWEKMPKFPHRNLNLNQKITSSSFFL